MISFHCCNFKKPACLHMGQMVILQFAYMSRLDWMGGTHDLTNGHQTFPTLYDTISDMEMCVVNMDLRDDTHTTNQLPGNDPCT